jgi:hypothetical protein
MIETKSYCHQQRMYTPLLSFGNNLVRRYQGSFCTQKFAVQKQIHFKFTSHHAYSAFSLCTVVESLT